MTNDLRIADAPLLVDVSGEEKLPTGGYGNYSTTINQIADFTQLKWKLATEGYVNNEISVVTNKLNNHTQDKTNPHKVTKEQVGLGEVDNTADLDKPISAYQRTAIDEKVAKTSIVDNLTTNESNKVLSAKQGKVLQDTKADKSEVYNKDEVYTKDETLTLEREDKYLKTWSGRTQEQTNKENPSPFDFNVKGNGVDNDTQAFADLEKMYQGQIIDLLGMNYRTTREFNGNKYINGNFIINGATFKAKDDVVKDLISNRELFVDVSCELGFGGLSDEVFPKASTVQQGVCILDTPNGTRTFISHNSIGDTDADNERARIVECEYKTDGSTANVLTFTEPLNIGHAQALGGWVTRTGTIYLYTTMKQTDGWSGQNTRKGISRITYKGSSTRDNDVLHYPLWGKRGSGHIFEKYFQATVGATTDCKYLLMIGEDSDGVYTMFVYDRAEVESATDTLLVRPRFMWVLDVPISNNSSPVGVAGDTHGIYVVFGTTSTFGSHEYRAYDFTGTLLRRCEFDDMRAYTGYDSLMAGKDGAVPVVQELEGAFVYNGELYTTMSDKWRSGADIVTFRGKNFACVGGANAGQTPFNRGVWVETSLPANKGEYDLALSYTGGKTTEVNKLMFRITTTKYSNSLSITSGAIPKTQNPYTNGHGKGRPYITYNYPSQFGIMGWSETTREFLPTLLVREGQFRFYDNTTDSTFKNYTSVETEDNGSRHYMTLRGYGGVNNTGYRVSLYADADTGFSGGINEFASASTSSSAVRSTDNLGRTIFRNLDASVAPLNSNRRTGAGVAQRWMIDGSTKLSVNASSSSSIIVANNGNRLIFATDVGDNQASSDYTLQWTINPNGSYYPNRDAGQDLATASLRINNSFFAVSPTISSDERLKQQFRKLKDSEKASALEIKSSICLYKLNDAVDLKGDGARWHCGVKAQEVVAIMQKHELNPFDYGFVCYDEWDAIEEIKDEDGTVIQEAQESGNRYAIRYDELIMFILASL